MKQLEDYVRSIPDFPNKGVIFRDVSTVIGDADGFSEAIDRMIDSLEDTYFDVVVASEARGFIFGAPIAYSRGRAFVPARKKGKLPCETIREEYDLEYGTATLELHKDAIKKGQKIVIVDDLLATGGTVQAMIRLVERLGGEVVKVCCLMELPGLNGRKNLEGYDVVSIMEFDGE